MSASKDKIYGSEYLRKEDRSRFNANEQEGIRPLIAEITSIAELTTKRKVKVKFSYETNRRETETDAYVLESPQDYGIYKVGDKGILNHPIGDLEQIIEGNVENVAYQKPANASNYTFWNMRTLARVIIPEVFNNPEYKVITNIDGLQSMAFTHNNIFLKGGAAGKLYSLFELVDQANSNIATLNANIQATNANNQTITSAFASLGEIVNLTNHNEIDELTEATP